MELGNVVVRTLEEDNQSIPCKDEENAPTDISNVFFMKQFSSDRKLPPFYRLDL